MYKNSSVEELLREYIDSAGTDKKQLMDQLLSIENVEKTVYGMVYGKHQRAALRFLADAARKKAIMEALAPFVVRDADKLLAIEDDKARKTASIFIGICAAEQCADKLSWALMHEKTRFVRPSMILALGNTSDPAKYLKDYVIEPGEEKHVREEAEALKKALSKTVKPKNQTNFTLPEKCILTSLHEAALESELKASDCVYTKKAGIKGIFEAETKCALSLRCWQDALFYIGDIGDFGVAARNLDSMGCSGLNYRIEARREGRALIGDISNGLSAYGYYDNPSAYSFQIRVIGKRMYAFFPDRRFAYRKKSIPASINPVAAASIMRICLPYMKESARVLDPFCGSGTMLIERGYIKNTSSLVGVDISPAAIKAACENRTASGLRIALINGDILGYGAAKYDEIISNMPFGLRVSGHSSNVRLYTAFAGKLETLLSKDGVAFLFTQEKKLLRDSLAARKCFDIIYEEVFETGGLYPTLFIIGRRGQ